jgi:CheY-like chemotaxis protein
MSKILVIDDSKVIRDLLTDMLPELGHEVKTANDGLEGMRMALAEPFDLCICDLHIPKMNGYQVFTQVTANLPNLPFILTDSLPDHLAEQALNAGAAHCLKKPFDLDQLRDILNQTLKPATAK